MLVVTRYRVPEAESTTFAERARTALAVLTARPGCTFGAVGRNSDDADLWTLTTTWASVGDYRRALGSYEVKLHAVPLMYRAIDEPSAYEELTTWAPASGISDHASDLHSG